jgi:hypothetical protein
MPLAGDIIYAADIQAIIDGTLLRPTVRLVQAVAQALTNNVDTPISFTTEEIDTHGFHDGAVNNSRITPSRPGIYELKGRVVFSGDNDFTSLQGRIAKNGAVQAPIDRQLGTFSTSTSAGRGVYAFGQFSADGIGDYFELMGLQQNTSAAATPTNIGGSFASTLECVFLRDL